MAKFIRSKAARFAAKIDWEDEKALTLARLHRDILYSEQYLPDIYAINPDTSDSIIECGNFENLYGLEQRGYKPVTYYTLATFRELQVADSQARIRKNLMQRLRRAK